MAHAAELALSALPQTREGAGGPWTRGATRGFAERGAQDRRDAPPLAAAAAEERGGPDAPPSGPAARPPLPGFLGREGGRALVIFLYFFFRFIFLNCDKICVTKTISF